MERIRKELVQWCAHGGEGRNGAYAWVCSMERQNEPCVSCGGRRRLGRLRASGGAMLWSGRGSAPESPWLDERVCISRVAGADLCGPHNSSASPQKISIPPPQPRGVQFRVTPVPLGVGEK